MSKPTVENAERLPLSRRSLARVLLGMIRQRCPRCLIGPVFRGAITMNETCPTCGLILQREEGYFLGAMYVSYALSVPILTVLIVALWYGVVPDWPLHWVLLLALAAFAPFMLTIFRYARILFIHFDRFVDP